MSLVSGSSYGFNLNFFQRLLNFTFFLGCILGIRLLRSPLKETLYQVLIRVIKLLILELFEDLVDFDYLPEFYEVIFTVHQLDCVIGEVV